MAPLDAIHVVPPVGAREATLERAEQSVRCIMGTVVILCPGGLEHGGGIGRQMSYFLAAVGNVHRRPEYLVVDTRGPWFLGHSRLRIGASLGYYFRSVADLLALRAAQGELLVHVNITGRGSTLRKVVLCGLANALGIPFLMHVHEPDYLKGFRRLPRPLRTLVRGAFRRAVTVIVLGGRDRERLTRGLGLKAEHVAMTVGALAGLHCLRTAQIPRLRPLAGLAIMGAAALLSQSATFCLTIATFCGLEVVAAMSSYRKGAAKQIAITGLIILVSFLIGAATASEASLQLIGKDPTLTGQTEIWEFVIRKIWERPVLGWDFFAFWSMSNPHAAEFNDMLHWVVPQAHQRLAGGVAASRRGRSGALHLPPPPDGAVRGALLQDRAALAGAHRPVLLYGGGPDRDERDHPPRAVQIGHGRISRPQPYDGASVARGADGAPHHSHVQYPAVHERRVRA